MPRSLDRQCPSPAADKQRRDSHLAYQTHANLMVAIWAPIKVHPLVAIGVSRALLTSQQCILFPVLRSALLFQLDQHQF